MAAAESAELAARVSQAIEEQRKVVAAAATGSSHCGDLAAVIIRHDKLQAHLEKFLAEHADDVAGRASAYHSEECPVCLDEIGHGGDLMRTRCGHTYHLACIIETLADGSVRSCPLCRTDIAQIADHGSCSGKVFTYMCLLRIAFDRVQAQTKRYVLHPAPPACLPAYCPLTHRLQRKRYACALTAVAPPAVCAGSRQWCRRSWKAAHATPQS